MADSVREQDVGAIFIAVKFTSEWRMRTVSATFFLDVFQNCSLCANAISCFQNWRRTWRDETIGRQQADQTAKSVMLLHAVAGIFLPI